MLYKIKVSSRSGVGTIVYSDSRHFAETAAFLMSRYLWTDKVEVFRNGHLKLEYRDGVPKQIKPYYNLLFCSCCK
jgi:hypothetical protein